MNRTTRRHQFSSEPPTRHNAVAAYTDAPRVNHFSRSRTSRRLRASEIECLELFCARVRRDSGRYVSTAALLDTLIRVLPSARILLRSARSELDIRNALDAGASAVRPDAREDPIRTFAVQLRNESIAALKMLSAAIRRESGSVMTMSAIVRPLIDWFAGVEVDTRVISGLEELQALLASRLRPE